MGGAHEYNFQNQEVSLFFFLDELTADINGVCCTGTQESIDFIIWLPISMFKIYNVIRLLLSTYLCIQYDISGLLVVQVYNSTIIKAYNLFNILKL